MENEFDVVAGWTEEAVGALGLEYALAAACRGSGSPANLAWLAEALEVTPSTRVLDAGSGVGGPAAWLARHFSLAVTCVEPMPAAATASARLFGLPAVVGTAETLPFAAGSFDVAWCLGVLCTTTRKAEILGELRRVLRPGGRLGLLVLVADAPLPPPLPEGNEFPSEARTRDLLTAAGFEVVQVVDAGALPDAPLAWQERAERVEAWLADRYGDDPRWKTAEAQSGRLGELLASGLLRTVLFHAKGSG